MNYRIFFETRAKKEFLNLPKNIQEALTDVLDDLQVNPRPPGAKKLTGVNGYRLRQGNYRMLYIISDKERVVTIFRAGHRKDVYRH